MFDPLENAFPTEWAYYENIIKHFDDEPCLVCGGDEHHSNCDTVDPDEEE